MSYHYSVIVKDVSVYQNHLFSIIGEQIQVLYVCF